MKRLLIGFVWRQIPVVSQFKLDKFFSDKDRFADWSRRVIDDYENKCVEAAAECEASVELLRLHGCSEVVVSPEAIGSLRIVLFDRFLNELPEETFVMVTSWGDFGPESTVLDCIDKALERKVYVITEQHRSLQYVPADHLNEAYMSLVRQQTSGSFRIKHSRREKIVQLANLGKTQEEILKDLDISRSTYYRIMGGSTTVQRTLTSLDRPQ